MKLQICVLGVVMEFCKVMLKSFKLKMIPRLGTRNGTEN